MQTNRADFTAEDFLALIQEHLEFSNRDACTHALGLAELRRPNIQMFVARDNNQALMGFAALKTLNARHGEIKSVRTHDDYLRKGVSRALMVHIEDIARQAGLSELYLETHNTPQYAAACRLYENLGYSYCGPFGDYSQNPRNVFMRKTLNLVLSKPQPLG